MKEEKRNRIIETAKKLFIEKGYAETKIEDITKEMKISKGNFYTYFKTKEDVLIEIVDKVIIEYKEVLRNIDITKSSQETIREYYIKGMKFFIENFPKISAENIEELIKNPKTSKLITDKEEVEKKFIKENIVSKYKIDSNPEFISKFIYNIMAWNRFEEVYKEEIKSSENYFEKKENEITEIVKFIHNGLKGKEN